MKTIHLIILLGISFLLPDKASGQLMVKKDLNNYWSVFRNNQYEPFTGYPPVQTIYFWIDSHKFADDYLYIDAVTPFSVFINGKLVTGSSSHLCIDSLAKYFASSKILVAVHQKEILKTALHTTIKTRMIKVPVTLDAVAKPPTFFSDFVVIAILLLLLMLIVVMYLNPKLAINYFSVTRIFSLREGDDGQGYTRISNSTNVLFYGFCSLILGFYLMIIFHFVTPVYSLANYFQPTSFFSALTQWLALSLMVLIIFFFKIILVYSVSSMFGSRDLAGLHFFNWVRMLLIIFGVMSIIVFVYFILHGQSIGFHVVLLKFVAWCLTGCAIIIFLKLNGRVGYSMFHLFSYLCVTEIIPLLIIITILYK